MKKVTENTVLSCNSNIREILRGYNSLKGCSVEILFSTGTSLRCVIIYSYIDDPVNRLAVQDLDKNHIHLLNQDHIVDITLIEETLKTFS